MGKLQEGAIPTPKCSQRVESPPPSAEFAGRRRVALPTREQKNGVWNFWRPGIHGLVVILQKLDFARRAMTETQLF